MSYLDRHGVIATPATSCAALAADRLAPDEIGGRPAAPRDQAALTLQTNQAGVPAESIPCGVDGAGPPLGLQLIERAGRVGALTRLPQALEHI